MKGCSGGTAASVHPGLPVDRKQNPREEQVGVTLSHPSGVAAYQMPNVAKDSGGWRGRTRKGTKHLPGLSPWAPSWSWH